MKLFENTFRFQTVVENKSRYPIDIVWENAQDLEHVAYLHQRTNHSFQLLHTHRDSQSRWAYDLMIYRATRKLAFLKIGSLGFRKIKSDYNIHQMEFIPALGITSTLNSLLIPSDDPEFPTILRDEVIWEAPIFFRPLENWLKRSLQRHTRLQCEEDEPFRARRLDLANRGIHFPFSVFNEESFKKTTDQFRQHLPAHLLRSQ